MIQKNILSLVCFMTFYPIATTTDTTAELVCSDYVYRYDVSIYVGDVKESDANTKLD
jgi:hypothetical protein